MAQASQDDYAIVSLQHPAGLSRGDEQELQQVYRSTEESECWR